jgi:hypothetical protein
MVRKASKVAEVRKGSTGEAKASDTTPYVFEQAEEEVLVRKIVRALRTQRSDLGEEEGEEASAAYLGASLLAYAADKRPELSSQWCKVLEEVLTDAACVLDDEDNEGAVRQVVNELIKRNVLVPVEAKIEEGSAVLAVLVEDDDWHEAVVQKVLGKDRFLVVFLQYGKPQETAADNIRLMEAVADDEGAENLEEGNCEMCGRLKLLTFHHLIPKDVHATYLKKKLPPGIEGEPTRHFLNSYGTMVCRQCHAFVHRLADNSVLAKEYNTLQKIMEQPATLTWVKYAAQQNSGR